MSGKYLSNLIFLRLFTIKNSIYLAKEIDDIRMSASKQVNVHYRQTTKQTKVHHEQINTISFPTMKTQGN